MNKIEEFIKEYSSKKLKEIIDNQSLSYSENFIDYVKDELIRRGESIPFNQELSKDVEALQDVQIKEIIEKRWWNFHLEYLELVRKEYLKRNFKNEASNRKKYLKVKIGNPDRYPTLIIIIKVCKVLAFLIGILAFIMAVILYTEFSEIGLMLALPTIGFGAYIIISLLATSELLKVLIDIEENTRKTFD